MFDIWRKRKKFYNTSAGIKTDLCHRGVSEVLRKFVARSTTRIKFKVNIRELNMTITSHVDRALLPLC